MAATVGFHVEDVGRLIRDIQSQLHSLRDAGNAPAQSIAHGAAGARVLMGATTGGARSMGTAPASAAATASATVALNAAAGLTRVLADAERSLQAKADALLSSAFGAAQSAPLRRTQSAGASSGMYAAPPAQQHARGVRNQPSGEAMRRHMIASQLRNPSNPAARELLTEQFGPLSPPSNAQRGRVPVARGAHASPGRSRPRPPPHAQSLPPLANRKDPSVQPAPPSFYEAQKGLLHLQNRGYIPAGADLTDNLMTGSVLAGSVQYGANALQHMRGEAFTQPFAYGAGNVRLDGSLPRPPAELASTERARGALSSAPMPMPPVRPTPRARTTSSQSSARPGSGLQRTASGSEIVRPPVVTVSTTSAGAGSDAGHARNNTAATHAVSFDPHAGASVGGGGVAEDGGADVERRTYGQMLDEYSLHHFIIRRGKTLVSTPEFVSFKRKNVAVWSRVQQVVQQLEQLLARYSVTLAYIDGRTVERLAAEDSGALPASVLLSCIVNADDVAQLIRVPGQRYKGADGRVAAAIKIQATFRMFRCRRLFMHFHMQNRAATTIQVAWRHASARILVARERQRMLDEMSGQWQVMQTQFYASWSRIKASRRVVVHIPSLSYDELTRLSMRRLAALQSAQIARICEAADPLVTVVYVTPVPLGDELVATYQRMMSSASAGGLNDSLSSASAAGDAQQRIFFLHPENFAKFPEHMSLAQVLRMSPRCLKRVRTLARSAEYAYIVPQVMSMEDVRLSLELGIPVLASDPQVSALYTTKSGCRRVFGAANVTCAPGEFDIYTETAMYTKLARLLRRYPGVQRWLFKIDEGSGARGIAYVDTAQLPSALLAGDANADVSEAAVLLSDALGAAVQYVVPSLYEGGTWRAYVAAFLRNGGVIEAAPPVVHASPTCNMLVEPDGHVQLLSTHDQIFMSPYRAAGWSFPQTSVPAAALRDACISVAQSCFNLRMFGYISVDFVVSVTAETEEMRLWAVDLNAGVSTSLCSFLLGHQLARGVFDYDAGTYSVADGVSSGTIARRETETGRRYFVAYEPLRHAGLEAVHVANFFALCRSASIAFDTQDRCGAVFNIPASLSYGLMGVLAIDASVNRALKRVSAALDHIGRELLRAQPQLGARRNISNFAEVLQSVKALLSAGTAAQQAGVQFAPAGTTQHQQQQQRAAAAAAAAGISVPVPPVGQASRGRRQHSQQQQQQQQQPQQQQPAVDGAAFMSISTAKAVARPKVT